MKRDEASFTDVGKLLKRTILENLKVFFPSVMNVFALSWLASVNSAISYKIIQ